MRITTMAALIRTPTSSSGRSSAVMNFRIWRLCAGAIQPLQPSLGDTDFFFFRALLWILCPGLVPGFAEVDVGNGLARRLPGLPAAREESGLPADWAVSKPVSPPGAALRICVAT